MRRVRKEDLRHVAKATGASAVGFASYIPTAVGLKGRYITSITDEFSEDSFRMT